MFKAELLYLDKTRNPWKLEFSFHFSWKTKFSVQCIAKYTAGARWGWRQKSRWKKKHFLTRWKKEHWCNRFLYPLLHTLFLHSYKLFLLLHTHTHTHTLYTYWYTHNLFFVLFIDIFAFNWLLLHTDISPSYLCHELTLQSDEIFFSFFLFLYLFFSSFLNPFSFLLWNCLSYIFLSLILIFFISISL